MKDVVDITKQLFAMSKVSHLPLPSAAPLPFPFSRHLSGAGLADARLARQETANLEHEAYTLRQRSAVRDEIKNVLDAHVRHEAQQRELEQQELVKTVMENVRKQLGDGKFQKDVLADAVASLESASWPLLCKRYHRMLTSGSCAQPSSRRRRSKHQTFSFKGREASSVEGGEGYRDFVVHRVSALSADLQSTASFRSAFPRTPRAVLPLR